MVKKILYDIFLKCNINAVAGRYKYKLVAPFSYIQSKRFMIYFNLEARIFKENLDSVCHRAGTLSALW